MPEAHHESSVLHAGGSNIRRTYIAVAEEARAPFRVTTITLQYPDSVLRERIVDQHAFTEYITALRDVIEDFGGGIPPGAGRAGGIIVAIKPGGKVRFWLDALLNVEDGKALALRMLQRSNVPAVQRGPVVFGLHVDYWREGSNVSHEESGLPFIPDEWREVMSKGEKPLLMDDLIRVVWPD